MRARAGFDSQRQHHAFEAHKDEQAILNRQAVGSTPTGRTRSWNCGRMVRRSTFNRGGESSILSSSTISSPVPKRNTKLCGVVAERQRHLTVHEDQVGSTPIHFAKLQP